MKDKISKNPFKPITDFFGRFNVVIFIVVVVVGLSGAILILSQILNIPYSDEILNSGKASTTFDESTIQRVNALQTSDSNTVIPTDTVTRINPFSN
jgi:hypothetical protein